jgi:sugar porter (SP) family MFS transporter
MNKIIYWSITVSLAGFLFGFDTAVISGADRPIQDLWGLAPFDHGLWIMSSALWGTVIGALSANIPCDNLGRKKTLIFVGILFLLSALGSALAPDPMSFSILRFIGGIGVGISSIVVPAYISEIAPANHRGRLAAMYQFQIVFGILIAFISNYVISLLVGLEWRVMLALEVVPALAYLAMVVGIKESPRWLITKKGDVEQARFIMQELGMDNVDKQIADIQRDAEYHSSPNLFVKTNYIPILLAVLIAVFNQLSGINFIMYFAPRVFELAGLDASSALLSTAGVGLTNLIFTMLGVYLIDRSGRKNLMVIGSLGYISSLAVVSYAFFADLGGMTVAFFIFMFIASHAIGQGAVIWVFIAEIFPNQVRTAGLSLGCGTHWVFAALITLLMPLVISVFEPWVIFGFFSGMMILQFFWVIFIMPETKGKSLEAVSDSLLHKG